MTREPGSRSPTAVDEAVGETIRKLRTEANLTLSELGQMVGISHQQMQKYEVGTNRLSAGMLHSVAEVLKVPIASLFETITETEKPKPAIQSLREQIAHRCMRTDDKQKLEQVYAVIKVLVP